MTNSGQFAFAAVGLYNGHIKGIPSGLIVAGAEVRWVLDPVAAKV